MLSNWKTTISGAASICTALGIVGHMIATGYVDPSQITVAVTAVLTGFGLVVAKDATK